MIMISDASRAFLFNLRLRELYFNWKEKKKKVGEYILQNDALKSISTPPRQLVGVII